jgi:signal transduction histidine kinase
MEDSKGILDTVLHSIPFGIIALDHSGGITLVNRQAADYLELETPEPKLAGLHVIECLSHIPLLAEEVEGYLGKGKGRFTLDAFTVGDRILHISGEPAGDGHMFIIGDITGMKEMEASSIQSMITGEENERKRLAREIHDGIAPMISYARLELDSFMDEYSEMCGGDALEKLGIIRQTLDSISGDLRDLSHRLIPRLLEEFGLYSAFNNLVNRFNQTTRSRVDLYCNFDTAWRIDREIELNLYRCGQELLNNAVKHAGAGEILVQLIRHERSIVLMVEDNGIGFDPGNAGPEGPGIGLTNIETRVRAMGGEFIIESLKHRGTTVSIEIPL